MRFIPSIFMRPLAIAAIGLGLSACDDVVVGSGTSAVDPNAPVVVALMVPLGSGNSITEQLAQNLVNAAKMAAADVRGASIDLRVYETAGDATVAAASAERAIEEGAQIIVGPLFSTSATAVAAVARPAGINVLSFSNNPAIAGGNIFILGTTFESVSDRLISHTVGAGFGNIAIVHQNGIEGEAGRDAVAAAVARNGGNLVNTLSYSLSLDEMSAQTKDIAAGLRSSGANSVFFTDSPLQGLGFMTAALASERFRTNRDAQFLGLTRWDTSDEVLKTPSLQGGWFTTPDPTLMLQYQTRYQLAYGTEAHSLSGLAYDGVAAVGAMINAAKAAGDTNAFSIQRLTDPAGFAGVTGIFRLRSNGTNQRALAIMQVDNGIATMISSAPRSFGGSGT
ncbi:MAG: penicillin-binding protein activator [Rhodobacteraceae bacterium]|nr:penicillin-binding protein activator [Paracoccaceae bacterium]